MAIERLAIVAIIAAALAGCSHSHSGSSTGAAPPNSVSTNEGAPAAPGAPPSYQPSHVTGTNTPGESGVSGSGSSTSGGAASGTDGQSRQNQY